MKGMLFLFIVLSTFPIMLSGQDSIESFQLLTIPDTASADTISVLTQAQAEEVEESEDAIKIVKRFESHKDNWFFIFFLFQLLLLAFIKWNFAKSITTAIRSAGNINLAAYQFREERGESSLFKILLNVNFVLSLSLFALNSIRFVNYQPPLAPLLFFFLLLFLFGLIYLFKYMQYLVTALVFPVEQTAQFYHFLFFAAMRLVGVILVPLNMLLYYSTIKIAQPLFYASLLLIGLVILYRTIRGLQISQELISAHKVHFILYICTLEILPILLLVKFLGSFI